MAAAADTAAAPQENAGSAGGAYLSDGVSREEIAEEASDIKVGKLNIDNEMEIAQKYGVMSIPTLIVYRQGEEVTRRVGVQSMDQLETMLGVN